MKKFALALALLTAIAARGQTITTSGTVVCHSTTTLINCIQDDANGNAITVNWYPYHYNNNPALTIGQIIVADTVYNVTGGALSWQSSFPIIPGPDGTTGTGTFTFSGTDAGGAYHTGTWNGLFLFSDGVCNAGTRYVHPCRRIELVSAVIVVN